MCSFNGFTIHFQKFEEELMRQEAHLRETLNIGQDIMKRCHPDALSTLKHWLSALKARWEEVGVARYSYYNSVEGRVSGLKK